MMKITKLISAIFGAALCLSSVCGIPASAEENPPVSITIESEKENYSSGDSLKFNVSVSNPGAALSGDISLQAALSDKFAITGNESYTLELEQGETKTYTISAEPVVSTTTQNKVTTTNTTAQNKTNSPKTGSTPPFVLLLCCGAAVVIAVKTRKSRKAFCVIVTAVLFTSLAAPGMSADTYAESAKSKLTATADFKYNNDAEIITITAEYEVKEETAPFTVNTENLEVREDGAYKTTDAFTGLSGTLAAPDDTKSFTVQVYSHSGELTGSADIAADEQWQAEGVELAEGYNKVVISSESADGTKHQEELVIFVPQILDYNKQALRDVTGVSNARQLGGYINTDGRKIKQNVVLRTANLAHITDAGIQALQNKYNLSDIVDLRYERELNPNTIDKEIEGAEHHSVPMSATKATAEAVFSTNPDLYAQMIELQKNAGKPGGSIALSIFQAKLGIISAQKHIEYFESDEAAAYYRDVFDVFLNKPEDAAVLFHCAGGKDRTGMVSMLLLAALDFDKDIMMQDYMMSNIANAEKIEQTKAAAEEQIDDPDLMYDVIFTAAVYPEVMETNINDLTEQYGSVKNFLREKVGITDEEFSKLAELYLED